MRPAATRCRTAAFRGDAVAVVATFVAPVTPAVCWGSHRGCAYIASASLATFRARSCTRALSCNCHSALGIPVTRLTAASIGIGCAHVSWRRTGAHSLALQNHAYAALGARLFASSRKHSRDGRKERTPTSDGSVSRRQPGQRRRPDRRLDPFSGAILGPSELEQTPFWLEVREAEQGRKEAARAAAGSDQRQRAERRRDTLDRRRLSDQEVESILSDDAHEFQLPQQGDMAASAPTMVAAKSSRPQYELETDFGIREISQEAGVASDTDCESWPPELSPACERLLTYKSAGSVLAHCAPILLELQTDAQASKHRLEELSVAAQVVGRWSSGRHKAQLLRDQRLLNLFALLGERVGELEMWGLVSVIRGLARLGLSHESAPLLLEAAFSRLPQMHVNHAALVLQSLAEAPSLRGNKTSSRLQPALLGVLRQQHGQLAPRTAASLVPALVRLRVMEQELCLAVATHVKDVAHEMHVGDLAVASAGLVSLRVMHAPLLLIAEKAVQRSVHMCTPRGVVQYCIALSTGATQTERETFQDFLMPAARSFLLDFSARDLCTLGETFCKARAADADFLGDLAHSLEPRVREMGAHEVSVALSVFSPVSHAAPQLIPAVVRRTGELVDELSPRQVARVLRGVMDGGWGGGAGIGSSGMDLDILASLRERAIQLAPVLFGSHATDMLMSLAETEQLTSAAVDALLGAIARNLQRMPVHDYIGVLHVLAQLPAAGFQQQVPQDLLDEVLLALRRRGRAPWRYKLDDVVYLFESLRSLGVEDEALVEFVCRKLHLSLKSDDLTLQLLLRLLISLGDLPPRSRLNVLTHIQRKPRLQVAMNRCVHGQLSLRPGFESEVALAIAFARVGFEDDSTKEWIDRVVSVADENLEGLGIRGPEVACDLCFTLATLAWQPDWNRRRLRSFFDGRYAGGSSGDTDDFGSVAGASANRVAAEAIPVQIDARKKEVDGEISEAQATWSRLGAGVGAAPLKREHLLQMAWAVVVVDDELPAPLLEELHDAYDGLLPSDRCGRGLQMLQVVALHWELLRRLGRNNGGSDGKGELLPHQQHKNQRLRLRSTNDAAIGAKLSADTTDWLKLVREAPRWDLHARQAPSRSERTWGYLVVQRYPHEHWISSALAQLRIPHEAGGTIDVHRLGAVFRRQRHAIDVLGLEDLSAPAGRVLGAAEVRRRQLLQLGWAVHSVKLRDLYDAVQSGSLRLLVAKLLSGFDPSAARASSFRESRLLLASGHATSPAVRVLSRRQPADDATAAEARRRPSTFDMEDDDEDCDDADSASSSHAARHDPLFGFGLRKSSGWGGGHRFRGGSDANRKIDDSLTPCSAAAVLHERALKASEAVEHAEHRSRKS